MWLFFLPPPLLPLTIVNASRSSVPGHGSVHVDSASSCCFFTMCLCGDTDIDMGMFCSDDLGHMTWEIRSWKYGRESLAWHGLYLIFIFLCYFFSCPSLSLTKMLRISNGCGVPAFPCSVWLYTVRNSMKDCYA